MSPTDDARLTQQCRGVTPPQGLDGKSFLPVLTGREKSFRDTIYASLTRGADMNIFP